MEFCNSDLRRITLQAAKALARLFIGSIGEARAVHVLTEA
jgi:hypothetical protein